MSITSPGNRRVVNRYRIKAPAIFSWERSRSDHFQGEGTTRDISAAGVYVLTATCPPIDSTVQMEVVLPQLEGAPKTRIKAEMKVLRVDLTTECEGRSGFSAVSNGFSLRSISKQPPGAITNVTKLLEEERKKDE